MENNNQMNEIEEFVSDLAGPDAVNITDEEEGQVRESLHSAFLENIQPVLDAVEGVSLQEDCTAHIECAIEEKEKQLNMVTEGQEADKVEVSEGNVVIRGTVKLNQEEDVSIAGAVLQLADSDDQVIESTITGPGGQFLIELPEEKMTETPGVNVTWELSKLELNEICCSQQEAHDDVYDMEVLLDAEDPETVKEVSKEKGQQLQQELTSEVERLKEKKQKVSEQKQMLDDCLQTAKNLIKGNMSDSS